MYYNALGDQHQESTDGSNQGHWKITVLSTFLMSVWLLGLKNQIPTPYHSQLRTEIFITGCEDSVFLELILKGWVPISFLAIYSTHACYVLEKGGKLEPGSKKKKVGNIGVYE